MKETEKYGLNERIRMLASMHDEYIVGRVVAQERGLYRIVTDEGEKQAPVSGKFMYNACTASEYPAVGDFVMIDINTGGNATIHKVLQRKTVIIRKAAGKSGEEQVVAANVDVIAICMSLNNDFNERRLERYLSIAWDSGAVPIVVLTKSDLCNELQEKLAQTARVAHGTDIVVTTSVDEDGYKAVLEYVKSGQTVAFIGSSGVGKSSLINKMLDSDKLAVNGLRNDDKGRHTTTHRELMALQGGGIVIDTPGMRELGMWDDASGIDRTFSDIEKLAEKCRFGDCTHSNEPGCAVCEAMKNGELDADRLQSYCKLKAENEFVSDSKTYLENKKKRFKEIAKYNKAFKDK